MDSNSVLVLENEDVEDVLEMSALIPELERMYEELAQEQATNAPRIDVLVPTDGPGEYYGFKTMVGAVPRLDVMALRVNSDIIAWREVSGTRRRVQIPAAPGERYVGDLFLWDTKTGAPFALMPDGYMQRMRVGGTSGVAAAYLAREDASTVGLLGSGWQAGGQLLALDEVRDIDTVDVYSPTKESREAFAQEFDERIDADVTAVDSAEEAVRGKDILDAATSSLDPVIKLDWLEPGMHVTSVKRQELTPEVFRRADISVLHSVEQTMQHNIVIEGETPLPEEYEGWWTDKSLDIWDNLTSLGEFIVGTNGRPARTSNDEISLFANNIGLGVQFAVAGMIAYVEANEQGLGTEEPVSRYTQEYIP